MLATHADAEKRYEELRKLALQLAQESATSGVTLQIITAKALRETIEWGMALDRQVDWEWLEGYSSFKFRYPKRFEAALWFNNKLISLSLGRPTYNGNSLRLDFIEAMPKSLGDRPPVFEDILVAYETYAKLINASEIRIMNPINQAVKEYYESYGYVYVSKQDYLFSRVK